MSSSNFSIASLANWDNTPSFDTFPVASQLCNKWRKENFKMWISVTPLTILAAGILTALGLVLLLILGPGSLLPHGVVSLFGGVAILPTALIVLSIITYEGKRKLNEPLKDADLRAHLDLEMKFLHHAIGQIIESSPSPEEDEEVPEKNKEELRGMVSINLRIHALIKHRRLRREGDHCVSSFFTNTNDPSTKDKIDKFEALLTKAGIRRNSDINVEDDPAPLLSSIKTV